ncbi:uncharacterized protein LOC135404720 [Pseudopipra pipra]|uniref:uncharacterized protein LOC135404720 n=1 Tax=Pseudopipra pipra TaxID=415032 RepID=UPI003138EE12
MAVSSAGETEPRAPPPPAAPGAAGVHARGRTAPSQGRAGGETTATAPLLGAAPTFTLQPSSPIVLDTHCRGASTAFMLAGPLRCLRTRSAISGPAPAPFNSARLPFYTISPPFAFLCCTARPTKTPTSDRGYENPTWLSGVRLDSESDLTPTQEIRLDPLGTPLWSLHTGAILSRRKALDTSIDPGGTPNDPSLFWELPKTPLQQGQGPPVTPWGQSPSVGVGELRGTPHNPPLSPQAPSAPRPLLKAAPRAQPPPRLPPRSPPRRRPPVTVTTGSPPSPSCSSAPPRGWLRVWGGPPSRERPVGTPLTLECHFRGPPDTALTWLQARPPGLGEVPRSCPWPQEVVATRGGRQMDRVVQEGGGSSTLTFPKLSHNDSGLFFCHVESGGETAQSCGTFVRVLEPVPAPFLALRESTKNRILTAQGVLLLLCSAGPGLLLLLRKRWANEQLLHPEKTTCEEENLYEGLNLDECSMYEDISRGVQPTYQDVGTLPGDSQLEKP